MEFLFIHDYPVDTGWAPQQIRIIATQVKAYPGNDSPRKYSMNPITREAKPAITETPPSPGCGNELQRSSHARHPTETSSPCVKRIIVYLSGGHGGRIYQRLRHYGNLHRAVDLLVGGGP